MPPVIKLADQNDLIDTKKYKLGKFPFEKFNPVQSRVFEVYDEQANIIIAANTSAGKTEAAEMIAAYEIRKNKKKALYLAPLKALAKEKIDKWSTKEHHFHDLKLSIVTGDYQLTPTRKKELEEADFILMTTEMLSSRCRNYHSEKNEFLKEVSVLICDESHLLSVPSRGDHLEVGLMKFCELNPDARIVFLSATMPNVEEIADWVSYILTGKKTYLIKSDYRPVPLKMHYERYHDCRWYETNERSKVDTALGIVEKFPDDKFLIFTHTKRTGELMKKVLGHAGFMAEFHHADLEKEERHRLEDKFRKDKDLQIVVATSTLAWGCYRVGSKVITDGCRLIDVAKVMKNDKLLSFVDGKYKLQTVLKTEIYKDDFSYRIVLESGERFVVSQSHVLLGAIQRNSPDWVRISDLRCGDYVATPSNLGLWNKPQPFSRFWYLVGFCFGDGSLTKVGVHADGSIKAALDICLGKRNLHAHNVCDMFNQEFNCSLSMYDDMNGVPHIRTKKRNIVNKFLRLLPLGRKNGKSMIPCKIYEFPEVIPSFIKGWFDADGGVEYHGNANSSVGLTCISKNAIEAVRTILLGFGIRCSFGRKKMQASVINGRLQKPVRKWVYRLRIFGRDNLLKFKSFIGFEHSEKYKMLCGYLNKIADDKESKDIIPARNLIIEHLILNNMPNHYFREVVGTSVATVLKRQDCKRSSIRKLVNVSSVKTKLTSLLEDNIYWSRVKEIKKIRGGNFVKIAVDCSRNYIGCNVISHNCNLPARRVVILGVHRGLDEVENYDIAQMCGRAGRVGLDTDGDAYVLVPESMSDFWTYKLKKSNNIESRLLEQVRGHYKCLAFHLVSEIHYGSIKTRADVHKWYKRSLAKHQTKDLNDSIVNSTINLLMDCGAIKEEDGQLKCSSIGVISSMFYYSPFDVSDLRKNFDKMFSLEGENNDLILSMALGNIDTSRMGICSKSEKDEMVVYAGKMGTIQRVFGVNFADPEIKAGFCYYSLLHGRTPPVLAGQIRNFQFDFPRMLAVLNALDSMSCKWGRRKWFNELEMRVKYGVKSEIIPLCRITDIGKIRGEKLYAAGFRTPEDVYRDPLKVQRILNMKKTSIDKICDNAKLLALT
jgi:replicative superfamily II helicase